MCLYHICALQIDVPQFLQPLTNKGSAKERRKNIIDKQREQTTKSICKKQHSLARNGLEKSIHTYVSTNNRHTLTSCPSVRQKKFKFRNHLPTLPRQALIWMRRRVTHAKSFAQPSFLFCLLWRCCAIYKIYYPWLHLLSAGAVFLVCCLCNDQRLMSCCKHNIQ